MESIIVQLAYTCYQAIMVRSTLRNKYLKFKLEIDKQRYNKQRNYCVKLLRLKKQKYCETPDNSKVTDSKIFWKIVSPLKVIRETPE